MTNKTSGSFVTLEMSSQVHCGILYSMQCALSYEKYGSCGYSGWNFACCAQYSYSIIVWRVRDDILNRVSYSVLQMLAFLATGKHPPQTEFGKNEKNKLSELTLQTHSLSTKIFSYAFLLVFFSFICCLSPHSWWNESEHKLILKATNSLHWFVCVSGEIFITHLILISFNMFYVSPAVSSEFK